MMPRIPSRPLIVLVVAVLGLPAQAQVAAPQAQPAAPKAQVAAPKAPAAPAQPAPAQPAARPRYWTTEWSLQDVDVQRLLSRLELIGVVIPIEAEGNISVAFTVSVPLTQLRDGKAYRFNGRLTAAKLRLEYLLVENFDAMVSYADGVMRLNDLSGRWADVRNVPASGDGPSAGAGTFKGTASLGLLPRGDLRTDLQAEGLPFGPLHDLVMTATGRKDAKAIGGTVSGSLSFRAPIDRLRDVTKWTVDADLKVDRFRYGGSVPLSTSTGPIKIRDGIIDAPRVEIDSPTQSGIRLDLAARADLLRQRAFQFRLRGNDLPLDMLSAIVSPDEKLASGKLDLDAQGKGQLGAGTWNIRGRIGSPRLAVLGQDLGLLEHRFEFDRERFELTAIDPESATKAKSVLLKQVQAEYRFDPDKLDFSRIEARIFAGTLNGRMTLARRKDVRHRFELNWNDLRPTVNTRNYVGLPLKISAATSGSIDWTVPAGSLNSPAAHRGVADLKLDEIRLGNAKVGQINLKVAAGEGALDVTGDGRLFGGTVSVRTRSETQAGDTWQALLVRTPAGKANVESMELSHLMRAFRPRSRRRWSGKVSAEADLAAGNLPWHPDVTLSAFDITVDGKRVSRRMTARLRLRDDVITIDRATGRYAGGQIWVEGRWAIGRPANRIQVRVSAVEADDALVAFFPKASGYAAGRVSGWLTITKQDSLRVRGAITARDSAFYSVPTGDIHTGVVGTITADLGRWTLSLPSIKGELAGGRINGDVLVSSSSIRPGAFDLSSRWRANKVDFGTMLAAMAATSDFAHGRISGDLTIGGRGIRSINDLNGRFAARLDATQAAAVPGLLKADQYLSLVSLSGVQFDEGYLTGLIAGGTAKIDELWLRGSRVKFWAEGIVRLADARMDLAVVLSTDSFAGPNADLLTFASQIAIQATLPVTALVEINRLLNNRTIHFDFFGPISDPRVRLKPLAILREEAGRFLIRELLLTLSAEMNM